MIPRYVLISYFSARSINLMRFLDAFLRRKRHTPVNLAYGRAKRLNKCMTFTLEVALQLLFFFIIQE